MAIFAVTYLLCNFSKVKNAKIIKNIVKDVLIILVLTAFYLIPLMEHKIYGDYTIFDAESMGATGSDVYSTCIGLKEWFSSEFSKNEFIFSFGIVITFGIVLTPFAFKRTKKFNTYADFLVLALLVLYMDTKLFPWILAPNLLTIIQFAWRLNGFFIFFISYICAVNIVIIAEMIKDNRKIIPVITMIVIFVCSWFGVKRYMPEEGSQGYKRDINFENSIINSEKIGPYQINREYLPLKAGKNISYIENRENRTYVVNGVAVINNENKDDLMDSLTVTTLEKSTLEFPYIYYHGYTVKLNGKNIKTYESDNGFLCADIQESGDVTIKYTGTVLEKVGYVISIIGLIAVINQRGRALLVDQKGQST